MSRAFRCFFLLCLICWALPATVPQDRTIKL